MWQIAWEGKSQIIDETTLSCFMSIVTNVEWYGSEQKFKQRRKGMRMGDAWLTVWPVVDFIKMSSSTVVFVVYQLLNFSKFAFTEIGPRMCVSVNIYVGVCMCVWAWESEKKCWKVLSLTKKKGYKGKKFFFFLPNLPQERQ